MLLNIKQNRRDGITVIWISIMLPILIGMIAFAVDISYMCLVRNHLQVAADAAAMGGVGALSTNQDAARATAKEIAESNYAGATADFVEVNSSDIVLGTWNSDTRTFIASSTGANAVQVTTRKRINLFFGWVFGMRTADLEATAIATKNPRDIAFIIDLSGSMNNDSEIWSVAPINSTFPDYPGLGESIMQDVFTDFGYGTYPGTTQFIGQVSGIPSAQFTPNSSGNSPIYNYLTNTYLVNNSGVATKYRIGSSDSAAVRKQKAYRWLIDFQLAPLMPAAKPTLNSDTNLAYWSDYLDYCLRATTTVSSQNSRRITGGANPYGDAWPNLNSSAISPFVNRVGYQTYVQFMMDYGSNIKVAGNSLHVPLSANSPDCPWTLDNDPTSPGYGLQFPPREQPTHAARLAIMAGINKVAAVNANVSLESRDHVCVITFDTASGTVVRYPLTKNSIDYEAARASVRDIQAVSDWEFSTASENALILAKQHLNPQLNPDGARPYSTKVLVFLTDGIPNIKQSSNTVITNFVSNNTGEWFSSGSYQFERNATLMQIAQIQAMGWKTHAVGVGLGTDKTLMDRMARSAGTAIQNPLDPNGPKVSWFAEGNPADYKDRLSAIFDQIASTPSIQLVK